MASNNNTAIVHYDCRVFICRYNREPVKKTKLYESTYYEINNGLQSVSVSLNKDGSGTATVNLFVPLPSQQHSQSPDKTMWNNVLLAYDKTDSKHTKSKIVSQSVAYSLYDAIKKYYVENFPNNQQYIESKSREDWGSILKLDSRKVNGVNQYVMITNPQLAHLKKIVSDVMGGLWGNLNDQAIGSVDSIPGQFENGISFSFAPILNDEMNECVFGPMDKIKIYMTGRFQGKSIDDDDIMQFDSKNKYVKYNYYQVFEGLINNTSLSFEGGTIQITLSAKDITRWLELSQFNVNPAIASNKIDSIYPNLGVKPYSTAFANLDIDTILKILIVGSTDDYIEITKSQYDSAQQKYKESNDLTTFESQFKTNDRVTTTEPDLDKVYKAVKNQTIAKLRNYWEGIHHGEDFNAILRSRYNINGINNMTIQEVDLVIIGEGLTLYREAIMPSDSLIDKERNNSANQKTSTSAKYYMKIPNYVGSGNFRLLPKDKGLRPGETKSEVQIKMESDFSGDSLWIDPAMKTFVPYRSSFNSFDLFQHNYRPVIDIVKEITAINEFEFFMDSTGILVCKTPDYNLNPGAIVETTPNAKKDGITISSEATKKFKMTDDKFLIKPKEILSYGKQISDDAIVNYCVVTGEYKFDNMEEVALNCSDWEYDAELCKRFGVRMTQKKIPLLAGGDRSSVRKLFAKSFMNRANANYKSASITIPLRPELQLAKTIALLPMTYISSFQGATSFNDYVEQMNNSQITKEVLNRVEVGYITNITHQWSPESLCTTQLSLANVRLWTQTFGELGYTRGNIVQNEIVIDYQKIESDSKNADQLQTVAYKRYQAALKSGGFYTSNIDGKLGPGTYKAVMLFINNWNQNHPANQLQQLQSNKDKNGKAQTEDPFKRQDIIQALRDSGLL